MVHGLNSDIEHGERVYHVQTQESDPSGPVIESLVYSGGRIVTRMTISYSEQASKFGLTQDDLRHVTEQQHWDLVRKIRRGMLDADEGEDRVVATAPRDGDLAPPTSEDLEQKGVKEILEALESRLETPLTRSLQASPRPAENSVPATPRGWWRRLFR